MYFKQFYLGCLAHASYLIGSKGEALVVDPQRDVDQYIGEAKAQKLKIKYILETHLHADFVSGHVELAKRTGAKIYFGSQANALFEHAAAYDGEHIELGELHIRFLETPGHTPESISYLIVENGHPTKVLTGDTLFIGDVGRPDLVGSKGFSSAQMAGMLYDSLHQKLLTLPDEVEVYPAHGAGSACGRNISTELSSTIGDQKKFNYALKPMSKEAFIQMMTVDLPAAPAYFSHDAELNRQGAQSLSELTDVKSLSPKEVAKGLHEGSIVLDVRVSSAFAGGHIPGSVHIELPGNFAPWAGALLDVKSPIILVGDSREEIEEAAKRLARVGLESISGYLKGGIEAWDRAGMKTSALFQMSIDELRSKIEASPPALQVLDVRQPTEYTSGHVPHAINLPLKNFRHSEFESKLKGFDKKQPTAVLCEGGYRSMIAASLLAKLGFKNLYNVMGGTKAWTTAKYPTESP